MPFRPSRFLLSRRERKARELYGRNDDAGKRANLESLFAGVPVTHIGEFMVFDVSAIERFECETVVAHVPTGKWRSDKRDHVAVATWLTTNLQPVTRSFHE